MFLGILQLEFEYTLIGVLVYGICVGIIDLVQLYCLNGSPDLKQILREKQVMATDGD